MRIRIGVLVAGEPPAELRGRHAGYGVMTEQLLRAEDPELEFVRYEVRNGEFPHTIDDNDAYLITGSRHGAYEELPWIRQLARLVCEIEKQRKPLVGICFGHQLIARALGGVVEKAAQGWGVGVHTATLLAPAPWMEEQTGDFSLVVSHQDQVLRLPERAELIAGSTFCPVAMFRIADHVFAMQAHPEFSREYSRDLMELRRELIGVGRIDAGLESLGRDIDSARVARWIVEFLHRALAPGS